MFFSLALAASLEGDRMSGPRKDNKVVIILSGNPAGLIAYGLSVKMIVFF